MADIFISYKSTRKRAVKHLARILELNGYSVWFDYELVAGKNFGRQIERQLKQADAVIVLWCEHSIQSDWVIEEASYAKNRDKIIPAWMQTTDLPLGFQMLQTTDLTKWDGNPRSAELQSLYRELQRTTGKKPKPQHEDLLEFETTWRELGGPRLEQFELLTNSPLANLREEPRFLETARVAGRFALSWTSAIIVAVSLATASAAAYTFHSIILSSDGEIEEFTDGCRYCPEMVVVEAGSFTIGSDHEDPLAELVEHPPTQVRIKRPFAISKYEILRSEFQHFVEQADYTPQISACWAADGNPNEITLSWRSPGYPQSGRHPVVCVSWLDAVEYTKWLSDETGEVYRLLSEAEWEYVATERGTEQLDLNEPGYLCDIGNIADADAQLLSDFDFEAVCADGYAFTSPAGAKRPNSIGIADMVGNVTEWVGDCWSEYSNQISQGRAISVSSGCRSRVARGGGWESDHFLQRLKRRAQLGEQVGTNYYGFRVAREME